MPEREKRWSDHAKRLWHVYRAEKSMGKHPLRYERSISASSLPEAQKHAWEHYPFWFSNGFERVWFVEDTALVLMRHARRSDDVALDGFVPPVLVPTRIDLLLDDGKVQFG